MAQRGQMDYFRASAHPELAASTSKRAGLNSLDWRIVLASALMLLFDGIFLFSGLVLVWVIPALTGLHAQPDQLAPMGGVPALTVFAIVTIGFMIAARMYNPDRSASLGRELGAIVGVTLASTAIASAFVGATSPETFHASRAILLWAVSAAALALSRCSLSMAKLQSWRESSGGGRNRAIVVVGTGRLAALTAEKVKALREQNRLVGHVTENGSTNSSTAVHDLPWLGAISHLPSVLARFERGDVLIAVEPSQQVRVLRAVQDLVPVGWRVRVALELPAPEASRMRLNQVDGIATLDFTPGAFGVNYEVTKRLVDLVGSLAAMFVWLPVMLVLAIAIKLDSAGPILFRQTRVGRDGRLMTMFKFRSMVADAANMREALQQQNEADGAIFKIKDDPRVTRVGRLLRRSGLDELPQLLNVLGGSMSLVGPRPPLPEEVECYAEEDLIRLRVRPGITGLWQVERSADPSFSEMVALDRDYILNWSLAKDISIILRTARVVFGSKGAY